MNKIQAYLNAPIPRKVALSTLAGCGLSTTISALVAGHLLVRDANKILDDYKQRNKILNESIDFLLDRADDKTIVDLNKQLDFWRVIRGQETKSQDI